jgi:hypothetical protein
MVGPRMISFAAISLLLIGQSSSAEFLDGCDANLYQDDPRLIKGEY